MKSFTRIILMLALCIVCFSGTTFAQEEIKVEEKREQAGVYLSVGLGSDYGGMEIQPLVGSKLMLTEATPFSLAVGLDFKKTMNRSFRLEIAWTYRAAKDETIYYSGEMAVSTQMLNLYFDYFNKDTSKFIPYAGLGVGLGSVEMNIYKLADKTYDLKHSMSGLAYSASAGITWHITDTFALDVNARYVVIEDAYKNFERNYSTKTTDLTMLQSVINLRVTF